MYTVAFGQVRSAGKRRRLFSGRRVRRVGEAVNPGTPRHNLVNKITSGRKLACHSRLEYGIE